MGTLPQWTGIVIEKRRKKVPSSLPYVLGQLRATDQGGLLSEMIAAGIKSALKHSKHMNYAAFQTTRHTSTCAIGS